jgi:large subunit ribosomal protein L24
MLRSLYKKGRYLNPEGEKICRFKKGDRLQVITGKHIKAIGTLREIMTKKASVIIEGVNKVVRTIKANSRAQQQGDRREIEAPIHVSNVALVCPKCLKPTRVGYQFLTPSDPTAKKRKVRFCKRCKAQIDD